MWALRLTEFLLFLLFLSFSECQEGYDYAPPLISETQLRPGSEAVGTEGGGGGGRGGGGGEGEHAHANSDDPLAWLKDSIPGEPDVDYPILTTAPETSFSCTDKADGMYADVEARCQPWHQCLGDRQWTFLCPNGTIFNQQVFTCVWWFDFDCQEAEGLYGLNKGLYQSGGEGGGFEGGDYEGGNSGSGNTGKISSGGRPGGSGGGRPSTGGSYESRPGRPSGGNGGGSQAGTLLPVISDTSEVEDALSGYEEDGLSGYEEDGLSGYGEQVTVSGPTPAQPDRLYGAPRVGRRRKGRRRQNLDG